MTDSKTRQDDRQDLIKMLRNCKTEEQKMFIRASVGSQGFGRDPIVIAEELSDEGCSVMLRYMKELISLRYL